MFQDIFILIKFKINFTGQLTEGGKVSVKGGNGFLKLSLVTYKINLNKKL